jgi:hypothetical protein
MRTKLFLLVVALTVMAAPSVRAQTLDALVQEFGAYEPKKGAQMVAACEERSAKLQQGRATLKAAEEQYALADKDLKDTKAEADKLLREEVQANLAFNEAVNEVRGLRTACDSEAKANPGAPLDSFPACRAESSFRSTVVEPRLRRLEEAEKRRQSFADGKHGPAVLRADNTRMVLWRERAKWGLGPDETVEGAIGDTAARCARLRAWVSLGARVVQREQAERLQQALMAVNQCRFADADKLINSMSPGDQRTALEASLSGARQREDKTRALYEAARAQFNRANTLARERHTADAHGLFAQALEQLRAARSNTRCANYAATIDRAVANLEGKLKGVGAVPTAPPSQPPGPTAPALPVTPGTAADQECLDLYRRASAASRGGSAAAAAAELTKSSMAEARKSFNDALALYRKGATMCRQGRFPNDFAVGVETTMRQLRAIEGRQ